MAHDATSYSVLGAARSGLAIARLLRADGARVFVSDLRSEESSADTVVALSEMGAAYEFGGHTDRVLDADILVLSPGVPDTVPIVWRAIERGMMITNEIELAARHCVAPIVAITGTNGKTTTTELAGAIFRAAGRRTFVAGNVGLPFSQIAADADAESVVVLETSSFQLEHISTFRPRVAMVLNITPDHMDRYASFADYAAAKFRVTMNQQAGDTLVYNVDDEYLRSLPTLGNADAFGFSITAEPARGAFVRDGMLMLSDGELKPERMLIPVDEIRIRGPHNLYNAMAAALAAHRLGVADGVIAETLRSFAGVPHRLELVRELDGVRWVNDSKATNVNSLFWGLRSFTEPIVLIAGGRSKKNEYDAILPLLEERVKAVVLIGEAADEMEHAFVGHTRTYRAGYNMHDAIVLARSLASPGQAVLLSPACASFDMFDNYEHRGEVFRKMVNELESSVEQNAVGHDG